MRVTFPSLLLAAAMSLSACSKKAPDAPPAPSAPRLDPKQELAAAQAELPAIQAMLPAALQSQIVFEAVLGEDEHVVIIRPKGWSGAAIKERLEPPKGSNFGFDTSMWVSENCDGSCEEKDWAAVAEKVDFHIKDGATVTKDESTPEGRVMVGKRDNWLFVVTAKWVAHAHRYAACRVKVNQSLAEAIPAFEAACRGIRLVNMN